MKLLEGFGTKAAFNGLLKLGIISVAAFILFMGVAQAAHNDSGVSITDYNRLAGNSVGSNWSNNAWTIVNGSLANFSCYANCTGFGGGSTYDGSYLNNTKLNKTGDNYAGGLGSSNAIIGDVNNWYNLTNGGFPYIGIHFAGTAPFGLFSGTGTSPLGRVLNQSDVNCGTNINCVKEGNGTLSISATGGSSTGATYPVNISNATGNISQQNYIHLGNLDNQTLQLQYQANSVIPALIQVNHTYANTNGNNFLTKFMVNNSGTSPVVAVYSEGVAYAGSAWGMNPTGISLNGNTGIGVETNYATDTDSVGGGIQIITQDLRAPSMGGTPVRGKQPAFGLLFQSNAPNAPPHNAIQFNVFDNTVDNTGLAQPASDNLIYVNKGRADNNISNSTSPSNGINFQYANFTNAAIVLPAQGNSGIHGLEWINGSGSGVFGYLDYVSGSSAKQTWKYRNGTADIMSINTDNVTINSLKSTTGNQSVLAVDSSGNLTQYTPSTHDFTVSNRALETVYTNNANTSMFVSIIINNGADCALWSPASPALENSRFSNNTQTFYTMFAVIPPKQTYEGHCTAGAVWKWIETY